jgi:hypothetical protein
MAGISSSAAGAAPLSPPPEPPAAEGHGGGADDDDDDADNTFFAAARPLQRCSDLFELKMLRRGWRRGALAFMVSQCVFTMMQCMFLECAKCVIFCRVAIVWRPPPPPPLPPPLPRSPRGGCCEACCFRSCGFASRGHRLSRIPAQASVPAACCARRALAHSSRCRGTQSARWHFVEQYHARGPRAGQLPHRLRCCSPPPAVIADRPWDVLQHRRRSTASVSAKSGYLLAEGARCRARWTPRRARGPPW